MKQLLIILFCLFLLSATSFAYEYQVIDNVEVLTTNGSLTDIKLAMQNGSLGAKIIIPPGYIPFEKELIFQVLVFAQGIILWGAVSDIQLNDCTFSWSGWKMSITHNGGVIVKNRTIKYPLTINVGN